MRFTLVFPLAALFTFPSLLIPEAEAAPEKRSFRAIVPIAQGVAPGTSGMKSQTVSVKIPPPPVPQIRNSLFPEVSLPETDLPPDAFEIPLEPKPVSEVEIGKSSAEIKSESKEKIDGPTLQKLRDEAHRLSDLGLTYKFGADDPKQGGMDCSGSIQHLLSNIGIDGVPRTSYNQYYWLRKKKLIRDVNGKGASKKLYKKLSPGDLIFWGGTWKSGHKVSHVMIYIGYDPTADTHYVFGARGKSSKGLLGNGVDIFELDPNRGRLVAHGKIPGLIYE